MAEGLADGMLGPIHVRDLNQDCVASTVIELPCGLDVELECEVCQDKAATHRQQPLSELGRIPHFVGGLNDAQKAQVVSCIRLKHAHAIHTDRQLSQAAESGNP